MILMGHWRGCLSWVISEAVVFVWLYVFLFLILHSERAFALGICGVSHGRGGVFFIFWD